MAVSERGGEGRGKGKRTSDEPTDRQSRSGTNEPRTPCQQIQAGSRTALQAQMFSTVWHARTFENAAARARGGVLSEEARTPQLAGLDTSVDPSSTPQTAAARHLS